MSKKTMPLVLMLLVLLGACNTMAGAGEDISRGGQSIERSADKHAP